MSVVTSRGAWSQGGGRAGSPLTQPACPGATLSPASLQKLSAGAGGGEAPDPLLLNRGQAASNRRAPACLPPSFLPPDVLPNYPAAALGGRWRSRLPEKGRGERERAERRAGEGGGGAATWCHGHPGAPEPVHARAGLAEAQAAGGAAGGGRRSRGRSGRRAELGVGGRAPASGRASSGSTSICCGRACLKPADGSTDGSLGGRTGR